MKWEYCLVTAENVNDKAFDELGNSGWELVGFDKDGGAWFKRSWGAE